MKLNVSLLNKWMQQEHFFPIQSNLKGMMLYGHEEGEHMHICIVMRTDVRWIITREHMQDIVFQVERKFLFEGYRHVEFLYVKFSENLEEDKKLIGEGYGIWLVNVHNNTLVIFENQPGTFLGVEKILEMLLQEQENADSHGNFFPIISIALILINVVIFFYMEIHGDTYDAEYMLQWGAEDGRLILQQQQYYRLFTSMFLHFGFPHLISNMVTLYFFGSVVERHMSAIKYLVFYVISGIAGSVLSVLYYYYIVGGQHVAAGASGAIFGVIGMLVGMVCVSKGKIEGLSVTQVVIMSLLVLYTGMQDESVDIMAHVGGFIMGMLLSVINGLRIQKN